MQGRIHVHGLIGETSGENYGPRKINPTRLWSKWFEHFGRCDIQKIKSDEAVKLYTSKYILKYADPDIIDLDLTDWQNREYFINADQLSFGFTVGRK